MPHRAIANIVTRRVAALGGSVCHCAVTAGMKSLFLLFLQKAEVAASATPTRPSAGSHSAATRY
jgi:hypothetical protein